MKFQQKAKNIRYRIFTHFFALIMFIIIILDIFFIYKLSDITEKNAHIYSYEITKQLGRNIEDYVNHMKKVSWVLCQDESLQNILRRQVDAPFTAKNVSLEQFKINANMANDIESIIIFGRNGITLVDSNSYKIKDYIDITKMDWYISAMQNKGKLMLSSSHIQNYIENNEKWVFSVSSAIIDKETDEVLGVMLVDMSYKKLADICNQITLGNRGYVYITSKNQDIIYHPQQQLIYSALKTEDLYSVDKQVEGSFVEKEAKSRLVTVHTLKGVGWTVVGVSYLEELLTSQNSISITVIIISILCILIALVLSQQISQEISKPILELENIMAKVEKGGLDVDIAIDTNTKEIQNLSRSFQTMLLEIKVLLGRIKDNEKMLRKSELKILQAQINPHFLYNALDTIIWLAEREEHAKVVNMTASLARYFRLSLSKGVEIIPIFSEIEHVKYYLLIQKIRYENKLTYSIDVDSEVYQYATVKIILQPLVENALYHGIKDLEEGGHIKISGKKHGDNIILTVEDNGKGMTEEQIDTILTKPISASITTGGVAIKNVHERLQVYFGKEYGLKYESILGEWTKVYVTIPAIMD
ncbi:sensor histidine kinase [Cellulosilyticum sp. I15G10I2]|uniref:sensor histidine kinase n=1 Tax=Cellulosilyticum sp. I15G10I2 TaxID=1892843 RepID=UPI00085BC149|nr:sensor histidine kinase [Cellulosilyticum sp. I15G10I2]